MFVGSVLSFKGQRVIILLKDCLYVTLHGEVAGTLFVVPVKVDSVVLIYFPISGDSVVLFDIGKEVFGGAFLHILNAKIIDYE